MQKCHELHFICVLRVLCGESFDARMRRWLKLTVAYDGTRVRRLADSARSSRRCRATLEATWQQTHARVAPRHRRRPHRRRRPRARPGRRPRDRNAPLERRPAPRPQRRAARTTSPSCTVEDAPEDFHATYDAVGKRYRYHIHNGRAPVVFTRHYAWHYPQPLDAAAMHAAGQALVGRHDFSSFETAGSERPDSIRTIHELTVVARRRRARRPHHDRRHRRRLPLQHGPHDRRHAGRSRQRQRATSPGPPKCSPPATAAKPAKPRRRTACFSSASTTRRSSRRLPTSRADRRNCTAVTAHRTIKLSASFATGYTEHTRHIRSPDLRPLTSDSLRPPCLLLNKSSATTACFT